MGEADYERGVSEFTSIGECKDIAVSGCFALVLECVSCMRVGEGHADARIAVLCAHWDCNTRRRERNQKEAEF